MGPQGPIGPDGAQGVPGPQNLTITAHNDTVEANAQFAQGGIVYTTNDYTIWWLDGAVKQPLAHPPSTTSRYDHIQGGVAAVWNVNHNLGFMPSVTILDSSDIVIDGVIQHLDDNNLTITLTSAQSGTALCR
jgi:hypothetical protein